MVLNEYYFFGNERLITKAKKYEEYLKRLNAGLEESVWKLTLMKFSPNAPEENVWLQGKNFLRRNFTDSETFAKVKEAFFGFLNERKFHFNKFDWYTGEYFI